MNTSVVIFDVAESAEGGYEALALGHSICTRGNDWDDLKRMAREAVLCHFHGDETPHAVRLRLVRDEESNHGLA